jgi:ubiquinone/menaquinone biosynthesis C-methylase UbiE
MECPLPASRHHAGVPALTSEQARRVYDHIGRVQDWQRFYEDAATTELVAHAGFDGARSVVELGFGTGRFAAALLARHLPPGATYLGVDVSPRMVSLASSRLQPWPDRAGAVLVGGQDRVPVPDGAADRFVSNYVFDLLSAEATRAALDEARRVLEPGGLLCVAGLTPGEEGLPRLVSRAWERVWTRWPALVGGCRPIRLVEAIDTTHWDVRHHRVVSAWGITSEVLIVARH